MKLTFKEDFIQPLPPSRLTIHEKSSSNVRVTSAVSPAGHHDDPYVIQEDGAAKLKLQMERHLDRKRAGGFQTKTLGFEPTDTFLHEIT